MQPQAIAKAAEIIWKNWTEQTRIPALPDGCRPRDRADGYAVQAAVWQRSGQSVFGWKIAATSTAGQAHIGVDGPLAGRLLSGRVFKDGAQVSLGGNQMRVAEVEFAFRLGAALPKRARDYATSEVIAAVQSMHPALEIPDSRYQDFVKVGAPQLIADNACACWFVLGAPAAEHWRGQRLAGHPVTACRNDAVAQQGSGVNVLGDPLVALTWIANELRIYADGLKAGDVVTTGTCVVPFEIAPGDRIRGEFGEFGSVSATIA